MARIDTRQRSLLIALATSRIHRAALCRLGTDVETWSTVRGAGAARETARRIGLPYTQLRRALDLRRHATTIAGAEERRAERAGARILCSGEAGFPGAFDSLSLRPPVVYIRGAPAVLEAEPKIAMVGARAMNAYGDGAARRFGNALASAGIIIVSGFAVGVDQAAHRAALRAERGRTVAVLGCGIDIDYPSGTRRLAGRVAEQGALITELPIGTQPRPFHFPMRNRLIAVLALGVLVVQAKVRSGSLITAHHALDLGRDVWAVPGPIDSPLAGGPNGLIADGAALVERPEDILDTLPLEAQQTLFPSVKQPVGGPAPAAPRTASRAPVPSLPGLPGTVLDALEAGRPVTADRLAETVDATVDRVLGALLELELAGHVQRLPGPRYARAGC